jgi:hypothetical protein
MADQRHRRPRLELEIDAFEDGPVLGVAERDVLERDLAVTRRERHCVRRLDDVLRRVDQLEDALAGRGRPLRLADPHPELA